jgi:hypothetical protein
MKRIIKACTILIVMIGAGLFMTLFRCSTRSFDDLNQEMEYLVSGLVEKDKSVRNCVLSVVMAPSPGREQRESPAKTVRCL